MAVCVCYAFLASWATADPYGVLVHCEPEVINIIVDEGLTFAMSWIACNTVYLDDAA